MKRSLWCAAFAALLMLTPLAASAASNAYVAVTVNLRAGPDDDYPRIGYVSAGSYVDIQGCVDDWSWCDVVVYGERGWVAGRYLQFEYENELVYVPEYGARLGLPIVSFVLGAYWDQHYRDRHWYRDRDHWIGSTHGHRPQYQYRGFDRYIGPGRQARQNYPVRPNLPVRPHEPRQNIQPRPQDQRPIGRDGRQHPQQFGRVQPPVQQQQRPQQRPQQQQQQQQRQQPQQFGRVQRPVQQQQQQREQRRDPNQPGDRHPRDGERHEQ